MSVLVGIGGRKNLWGEILPMMMCDGKKEGCAKIQELMAGQVPVPLGLL